MSTENITTTIPCLLVRDIVVFPHMVVPLFVGRRKSVIAIERALQLDGRIFCVAQKSADIDDPGIDDLHAVGTIVKIPQTIKLPDGTYKILVEGCERATLTNLLVDEGYCRAECELYPEDLAQEHEYANLSRALYSRFEQYAKYTDEISKNVLLSLSNVTEPGRLADLVTLNLPLEMAAKQAVLQTFPVPDRVEKVVLMLHQEVEWMKIDRRIQSRVKQKITQEQEKYYKHQKLKAIQEELGDGDFDPSLQDVNEYQKKIDAAKLPADAKERADAELNKLRMMSPMSAEATVIRMYLEWLLDLPWHKRAVLQKNLVKSAEILDQDHYGLDKVKERILESLAVQLRVKAVQGPVICLVGPPGVGKTSLGKSVARAVGRPFVRISLGGVRDESEIRGHRKTYIGAMPGRIIKAMKRAKVVNPLIMLDEVDKMGMDFRGDPSSALLEVLDPEQNKGFSDHYLETEYDLSQVLFLATANSMDIPLPLLDRMEIIRLSGYTEREKLHIAKEHLLKNVLKKNGIVAKEFKLADSVLIKIIRQYTREAGVRDLDRKLDKIARKVVRAQTTEQAKQKKKVLNTVKTVRVTTQNIVKYLDSPPYDQTKHADVNCIGMIKGLAWTAVGGELLSIEALKFPGKGNIVYTGSLGDVMQESIRAAYSLIKSRAKNYQLQASVFSKQDVHVHVPEGATPKDGPSAGVGMCSALLSVLAGIPIRHDIALTGEITLSGKVLAIGGLKEKCLAALRYGIAEVVIPAENANDLRHMPREVLQGLKIHQVKDVDEVFALVLEYMPNKDKMADA